MSEESLVPGSPEAIAAWRAAELAVYRAELPLLARGDLLAFVELTHPEYLAGRVHEELCAKLMAFADALARKESPRLIICMPPRHGKTAIASQRFPVWVMGCQPRTEVICASYSDALAMDNSREARRIARSPEVAQVFPGLAMRMSKGLAYADRRREETDQVANWRVTNGGVYRAVGRGGSLTGRGARLLVLDDMLKDNEEADSATVRDGLWHWYQSTAYTRVGPGGGILVVTTRWHEDDLVGRLLRAQSTEEHADQWEVFNLAAIAEQDEGWRRAGEPLHPERWPLRSLYKIRATIGPRFWSALYQGEPRPDEGLKFRRSLWVRYKGDPEVVAQSARELILSVDCANEEGAAACYSVMHVFGLYTTPHGDRLRLLHEERGQWELPELLDRYDAVSARFPRLGRRLVEYAANGIALCQMRPGTIRVPPRGDKDFPGGSKEQRAEYTLTALQSGLGPELPESRYAPWAEAVIEEHAAFPVGKYKDRVDTVSQVCIRLMVKTPLRSIWEQFGKEMHCA